MRRDRLVRGAWDSLGRWWLAVAVVGARARSSRPAKKLLFLTHAGLYKHTSLGPAEKAVIELGKTGRLRRHHGRGLQAGGREARLLVLHARVPGRLRRPDDDDQRQPADDRRAEEGAARLRAQRQGASSARTARRSPSTTIRSSARCSAATTAAPIAQNAIGVLKVEDPNHPGDEDARRQLAAGRRVLPLRHRAVGRGPAQGQHRRAVRQSHPHGVLARSRARAAEPRYRRRPTSRACRTW